MKTNFCPCLSGLQYESCCAPLHQKQVIAASAEQLMRSRYSAFVKNEIDYLLATLHPDSHQPNERDQLTQSVQSTRWLGLQILSSQEKGHFADVEFIAFYKDAPFSQIHEKSHFIKEKGQWFYVNGDFLPPVKIGRNNPCFCGSGKKFKHCHANPT